MSSWMDQSRRWSDGRWVERQDIWYEDLVKIESPDIAGTPPKRDMYLLRDKPFSPVARWTEVEGEAGEPPVRKAVYCGICLSLSHQFEIKWLIRSAKRRRAISGGFFWDAPRAESEPSFPRYDVPADVAIKRALALAKSSYSGVLSTPATRSGTTTGLGDAVDAIVAKSPTMQRQIEDLKARKWAIEYQQPGLASAANSVRQTIYIGDAYRTRPEWAVSQLSHELGHFDYPPNYDYSSKAAFLQSEQLSESYATISNIAAQREIVANGGPRIPVSVNPDKVAQYNQIYDQGAASGDWSSAAASIGHAYGDGEKSIDPHTGQLDTYNNIFGNAYDARPDRGH